jgi:hypothetical protein
VLIEEKCKLLWIVNLPSGKPRKKCNILVAIMMMYLPRTCWIDVLLQQSKEMGIHEIKESTATRNTGASKYFGAVHLQCHHNHTVHSSCTLAIQNVHSLSNIV